MLKALELVGFKSFADKTRFDFPDGITVVVGPNGSGKSNIVDAMKWVLGSQSAKALRGKEMSDVIFKGSQTRGPAGSAEVTIVFDNPGGVLPVDTPEVRVTRRVYRSGEGEYLINGSAVRLKDVRDMVRGTGIGIDAYSLIEQGKVDKMLNASAKDRRGIFEEAAGISRFKAKKAEAERRLARVQTNLTRLGDIVDEVGTRLKSLRSQAGKAERYRVATTRMRELRVNLAWTDWTTLSTELDRDSRDLAEAATQLQTARQRRDELAESRRFADSELQRIAEHAAEIEQERQRLATELSTTQSARSSAASAVTTALEAARVARSVHRQACYGRDAIEVDVAALTEQLRQTEAAVAEATRDSQQVEQSQREIADEVAALRQRRDESNREHLAITRRIAETKSNLATLDAKIDQTTATIDSMVDQIRDGEAAAEQSAVAANDAQQSLDECDQAIAALVRRLEDARDQAGQTRRLLDQRRDDIRGLEVRREGVAQRLKVLEELRREGDGLSAGVRDLLQRFRDDEQSDVQGLVADLFEADVDVAPLVDAALGKQSQYIVVTGDRVQRQWIDGGLNIESRVGLIRVDELPPRRQGDRIRLEGLDGVLGRADRMVRYDDDNEPLVRHLLSRTWFVDRLQTAFKLRKLSGAGLQFVTANGELLDADGSIVVGPPGGGAQLVSRRSQHAAAADEIKHFDYKLSIGRDEAQRLAAQCDEHSALVSRLESEHRAIITDRATLAAEAKHARSIAQERRSTANDMVATRERLIADRDTHRTDRGEFDHQITQLLRDAAGHRDAATQADEALGEASEALGVLGDDVLRRSVELATARQSRDAAASRCEAVAADQNARRIAVAQSRESIRAADAALRMRIVRLGTIDDRWSELWSRDEAASTQLRCLAQTAREVRATNRDVIEATEAATTAASEATTRHAELESRIANNRLRRETLATRLREDYSIDLDAEEVPEDFEPPEDRDAVEQEIAKLRGQVQTTTNVNMEALRELEELQERYDVLHGQYQDLTAAKDSLARMIGKINADSRRLFMDTLEAIRTNFQQLYRKSFGGGHADLILEDSDDPMEAGVEIVATPPGKPSFSNSLLSGGEKALTAVALLMSIFKYRPSPFCVLDEVDAPFDEANIGRFVTVLNEFLDHSKFVIVTHSKKTMTSATTLYGVTMQESGVSKQVSIRFEDVSDNGEISEEAA